MEEQAKDFYTLGKRLKIARILAGCDTRKEFSALSSIPLPTLEAWEREKSSLTLKGARRLVKSLYDLGIHCREEWLLYGKGGFPHAVTAKRVEQKLAHEPSLHSIPQSMLQEVDVFLRSNPLSVVFQVNDDGMEPFYLPGDIVGGVLLEASEMPFIVDNNAIIEKRDGTRKVRRMISGIRVGLYSATCLNLRTKCIQITDYNLDLKSCARVIWHRSFFKQK